MKLIINGENKEFEQSLSLNEIIKNLKVEDKVVAAAVNMNIIKKQDWSNFIPQDNDSIELLNFVGGG